jgi:hypothetical protein
MGLHTLNPALASTAARPENLFPELLPWLLVLLGVVIIGVGVIYFLRRAIHSESSSGQGGFTLQDLRDLHRSGELSDEEFERAKNQMVGRLKAAQTGTQANTEPGNSAGGA